MSESVLPPQHITVKGIDASQSDMSPEGAAAVFVRLSETPNEEWSMLFKQSWSRSDHSFFRFEIGDWSARAPGILISVSPLKQKILEAYDDLTALVNATNTQYGTMRDRTVAAHEERERERARILEEVRKAAAEISG